MGWGGALLRSHILFLAEYFFDDVDFSRVFYRPELICSYKQNRLRMQPPRFSSSKTTNGFNPIYI